MNNGKFGDFKVQTRTINGVYIKVLHNESFILTCGIALAHIAENNATLTTKYKLNIKGDLNFQHRLNMYLAYATNWTEHFPH